MQKIKQYKQQKKQFSEIEIWNYAQQIALALEFLHRHSIIHRDIKTQNIFLTKDQKIKIGDLGFSKIIGSQVQLRAAAGTPLYLAPELVKQKPYDFSVDLWAFGCVLYHLAALEPPFQGDNLIELGFNIVHKFPKPINQIFSLQFKKVLFKLLDKNPQTRLQLNELKGYFPIVIKKNEDQLNQQQLLIQIQEKIKKQKEAKQNENSNKDESPTQKLTTLQLLIKQAQLYDKGEKENGIERIVSEESEYDLFKKRQQKQQKKFIKPKIDKRQQEICYYEKLRKDDGSQSDIYKVKYVSLKEGSNSQKQQNNTDLLSQQSQSEISTNSQLDILNQNINKYQFSSSNPVKIKKLDIKFQDKIIQNQEQNILLQCEQQIDNKEKQQSGSIEEQSGEQNLKLNGKVKENDQYSVKIQNQEKLDFKAQTSQSFFKRINQYCSENRCTIPLSIMNAKTICHKITNSNQFQQNSICNAIIQKDSFQQNMKEEFSYQKKVGFMRNTAMGFFPQSTDNYLKTENLSCKYKHLLINNNQNQRLTSNNLSSDIITKSFDQQQNFKQNAITNNKFIINCTDSSKSYLKNPIKNLKTKNLNNFLSKIENQRENFNKSVIEENIIAQTTNQEAKKKFTIQDLM